MNAVFFDELRRRGVLRVAAVYIIATWLIIQVADVFFPAWNIPDAALQYLLAAAVLGFPIALVFGWKYDITAEGVRRTPALDEEAIPSKLGRADYITLATLAVAAVLIVYSIGGGILEVAGDGAPVRETSDKRANSIAVLPFVNVSDDPSNEFFCDGVSEEILHRLAEYRDMHVIARTSSFSFKGSNLDAARLSDILGVQYVLQGSVRKFGDSLRISAELVDEDNYQIWNQTFDRELIGVFAIQSEIAAAVAQRLASTVLASHVESSSYEPDIDAYQQFLLGREYLRARTPGFETSAIRHFDAAIAIDDRYAAPHAGRAIALLLTQRDSTHYIDRQEAAERSIETAFELDANNADAFAANGLLLMFRDEHAAAESSLRQALALDPNVVGAHVWLVSVLYSQGKSEENLRQHQAAVSKDPLDPRLADGIAARYASRGDFELAEQQYQRMLDWPQPPQRAYFGLVGLYTDYGRFAEMIAASKQWILANAVPDSQPHHYYPWLAIGYARLGMNEDAEYWQSRAESVLPVDLGTTMRRAYIAKLQGRYEEAEQAIVAALNADGIELERASPFISRVVGAVRILNADYASGTRLLESSFELDNEYPGNDLDIEFVQTLAYGYRELGDNARADEILSNVQQILDKRQDSDSGRNPQTPALIAANYVIAGRHDEALDALEQAVAMGYRHSYWLTTNPGWQVLHDDPRFLALMSRIKKDLDAQRVRVERMDAENDFRVILANALQAQ